MAISNAACQTLRADPNVAPLIDVLLVLLILFMVIVPVAPQGLEAVLPRSPKELSPDPSSPIVIQILAGGACPTYKINGQNLPGETALAAELKQIFSTRAEKVLFLEGDPSLDFAAVAHVIDLSHSLGLDHIAILTRPSYR